MTEFYRFIKSKGYRMRHSLFFPCPYSDSAGGNLFISGIYGASAGRRLGAFDNVCDTSGNGLPCYSRNRNGNAHGSGGKSGKNAEPAGSTRPHKALAAELMLLYLPGLLAVGIAMFGFGAALVLKGKKEWG